MPYRRGILAVAGVPESDWRPLMGAYLAAGAGVVASHWGAGGLHRLPGVLPGTLELTSTGNKIRLAGVRCHRASDLPANEIVAVQGFRATSAGRTLLDLAGVVDRSLLARMTAETFRRRLASPVELDRLLALHAGPGARVLREVLDAHAGGDSGLEALWLRRLVRAGLRPPALQHQLVIGGRVYVLDFAWPLLRVGIEVDGWSVHRHRHVWDRDHEKANAYAAAGWRVLFVTSRTRLGDVLDQLAGLLAA